MHALFITMTFAEIPPSTQRLVADIARRLRRVEGLLVSTWARNGRSYALWQVFEDRDRLRQYLDGPILQELARLPDCADLYIQEFAVAEGLNVLSSPAAAGAGTLEQVTSRAG